MPDSLLTTKLFKPFTRRELVPRARLINQLDGGLHRILTLISAPAGFGKTTLTTEWVDSLRHTQQAGTQPRVAWLSIDEADNDLNRFLTYFFTAITQIEGLDANFGKAALEMLQSPNPMPIETILTPLISDLSSTSGKILLVLDDYHLIEDLTIHRALNFWLENVPPQVHTVVLTREDPPFPLARLRARGQLTELRAADLRFTAAESTRFLNDIMGLQLDAKSIALLEERTEGWIAGLQMAALSMKDRSDVIGFIENFSGTNRYILDYLLEEVLANQPPEIQQFLLQTSILQRLSAPLCDALLELNSQSVEILAYLERTNLFLLPLDDERIWYRYHHLFADLLQARLLQTHTKQERAGLHTRAATWYEDNRMAYGAIYHASLIPNDEWVEHLIDQNYMDIFQRRDSASIRNWTGELSKELIFKRPRLAIHEANSRAWFGQLAEADQLLNEAEKRLEADAVTPETEAMFGYLAYVRSRITAMRGDFDRAIQLCQTARKKTPASNPGLLGGIGVMLGYGYFLNGEFDQSIQTLHETIQSGKTFGAINTTIGAYCVLARLYAAQGRLQKSFDLYREAQQFIHKSGGEHKGAMSIVDVGFAEVLYEKNDLEAALSHIRTGLEFISLWSKADDIALAHILYSQIQLANGNRADAEKNIAKGSRVIQSSGVFPEARDAVLAAEMQMRLDQEDRYELSHCAGALEKRLTDEHPFRFENELIFMALARMYTVLKKFDQGIALLSSLKASAQLGGRTGRLIKILILQALMRQEMGESPAAFSVLEQALALAEPEGYLRTFLDEGQPARMLLSRWILQAENNPLADYTRHLLTHFEAELLPALGREDSPANWPLVEPLSPREVEVLELIALGKTNKEISAELVVSPGTVKAHSSNIYRKLDVANRTEAVARARALDLLS